MTDRSLVADRVAPGLVDPVTARRARPVADGVLALVPPSPARASRRHAVPVPEAVPRTSDPVARVLAALRLNDSAAAVLAAAGAALVLASAHGAGPRTVVMAGLLAAVVAVPLWLAALLLARAYEPRYLFAGSAEVHRIGIAGAAVALVVTSAGWLALERGDAPVVLAAVAVGLLLTWAGRWIIRLRVQRANRAGLARSRVLLVGDTHELAALAARLRRNRYHGWDVVALHALDVPGREAETRAASVRVIATEARRHGADTVLLASSGGARLRSVAELQRDLHGDGRDLALAPPLVEAVGPRVSVDPVCGLPVLRISAPELGGPRRVVKDVADRAAALVALVVLLPVLVVITVAVRLGSRGPAFFRQKRVGRDGRLFTIWKFRTMFVDAAARQAALAPTDEGAGPLFKIRRDPRVTPTGRWLRRTSLDELPQLWNVLAGDMSMVGPRPALPREVMEYDDVTRRRLMVRPGLTGLWQIHGRSDLAWDETSRLDVRYVENWSLGFDLSILLRTVDAVLRGRGAY